MKNILKLMLAAFVLFGAASCNPWGDDDNWGNNGGSNGSSAAKNFTIKVTDITTTGAKVSVIPSNVDTYYFDVMEQSTINGFSSMSAFATAYVEYLQEYAASYGYSLADTLSSGNDSYTITDTLEPGTKYYAFAFGLNANGTITTDVTLKSFTTLSSGSGSGSGATSQNTFSLNVTNITSNSATINVTPSNSDTYYFDLVEKEVYVQYIDSSSFAADYIADLKAYIAGSGYTLADVLSSGNDGYTYDGNLDAGTTYVAFAFGVNASGEITTAVTSKEFTTLSSGSGGGATSQNTFEISVSGITSTSATVSVNPSNSDTYYFDVYPKDVADQYGGLNALASDYVAYLKELYESYGYTFADALSTGADYYTFDGNLDPSTTYYAFAFGVNADGTITTEVTSKTFTTEASGSTGGSLDLSNLADGGYMNYGDYYEVGANNWYIELYTADYSEMVVLEVQTSASATSCVGTYPFNTTFAAGSAISGFIYEQYLFGSYWAKLSASTGDLEDYALINNGSLSISKSGSNYVIALDATTDEGSAITASYNGELIDYSTVTSVMSNTPARKKFRITNLDSFKKLGGKNIMLKPISKKLVSTPAAAPLKMTIKKHANIEAKAPKFTVNKAFTK